MTTSDERRTAGRAPRPKKSLGQNFLMHARIAERIADAAGVGAEDAVLEIGPGTGMLTAPLLARAKTVIAIEADGALIPALKEKFAAEIARGKLELVHEDIRAFDPSAIAGPYKLVANIPYYITGEIIRSFLEAAHKPESMTLLVQKEVAERIARQKGKRAKGSLLSVSVKAFGEPKYCFTVPRGAFKPAPNVDSAVLHIGSIRGDAFASKGEEERFFAVARAGFAHKRKLLAGNLGALAPRDQVMDALAQAGIAPNARAEDVSVEGWRVLARLISA
jgi:16S rRNA (adenine1518-N6/adenine1519-N6)-dimethyltransferase